MYGGEENHIVGTFFFSMDTVDAEYNTILEKKLHPLENEVGIHIPNRTTLIILTNPN